MVSKLMLVTL